MRQIGTTRRLILIVPLLLGLLTSLLPPSTVAAATDPVDGEMVPRASTAVTVRRGGTEITVRPIATVVTDDGRQASADRVIVAFRDGVSADEQAAVHQRAAATGRMRARAVAAVGGRAKVVDVAGAPSLAAALATYRADGRVAYAEPDYIMRTADIQNDPRFAEQWGMATIQAPAAWEVTHGAPSRLIAVLDCGIYEQGSSTYPNPNAPGVIGHQDINGKVALHKDFTGSSSGADDVCNHGTHVAGIAAAATNNGIGVAGVGYGARLLNGKVLDDTGSGTDSQVAAGVRWAADNGANVINMSLGGPGPCPVALQEAIDYAWARNAVVVVAAGNDNTNALHMPASCNHVLAVASTTTTDARSSFSNFGTWVDVAAPGSGILSSNYTGGYVSFDGTSQAAPHVAGLAALVWASCGGTSAQAVVDRITGGADAIAGTGSLWQYGRINAARAVCASAIGGPLPTLTTPSHTNACPILTPSQTLTIKDVAPGQQLRGKISVQYIVPATINPDGRVPLPNSVIFDDQTHDSPFDFTATGDVTITTVYPPVAEWPAQPNGTAEIHIDIAVEVWDGPVLIGTLGPGRDWAVYCIGRPTPTPPPSSTPTPSPTPPSGPGATPTPTPSPTPPSGPGATPTPTPPPVPGGTIPALGQPVQGTITPGGVAAWQVGLTAGQRVRVTLSGVGDQLQLYDPAGQVVASSPTAATTTGTRPRAAAGAVQFEHTAAVTGLYRIVVRDTDGVGGAYDLLALAVPTAGVGELVWYFAEGWTGPGFDEYLTIQNPNPNAAQITIIYFLSGAPPVEKSFSVPASSRDTVVVYDTARGVGRNNGKGWPVSARVASTNGVGIVVERPIYFTYTGGIDGGHNVMGVQQPRATWYFAEGYTGQGFDEYLTIMNPQPVPAVVMITYYRVSGGPVVKTITVPPTSRYTVAVHDAREGVGRDQAVSAKVESGVAGGIVVERPIYFTYGSGVTGGHIVMGAAAPRTAWYFPAGDTRDGWDTYLTLMNPSGADASVRLTYYVNGLVTEKTLTVLANSRWTVEVHRDGQGIGRGRTAGIKVESVNGVGVVAERPMYFRNGPSITGGHDVMGAVQPARTWLFAEGYTGAGFDEYLTILNPTTGAGQATITYYVEGQSQPTIKTISLPAQSQSTVAVHDATVPGGLGRGKAHATRVDTTVDTTVERPMYFTYGAGIDGGHTVMGYAP